MTPLVTENNHNDPKLLRRPTILLIEDYSEIREMIAKLLRRRGYNVIEAEDTFECLLEAACQDPNLILVDIAQPEIDCIELTKQIHAIPKLAHIPIIVLSTYLNESVEKDFRATGYVEMFPKPFDAASFLSCIEVSLSRKLASV